MYKKSEIKEMSVEELIGVLCHNMVRQVKEVNGRGITGKTVNEEVWLVQELVKKLDLDTYKLREAMPK